MSVNKQLTRSSATAEIAQVNDHHSHDWSNGQDHSRSLISVPIESLYETSY